MEQILSPYLPPDRRRALARGEPLPERAVGAALFADISGFTPLAESLVERLGPQRGAEALTRHLNWLYEALIAGIEAFGGSVIGFSGDGMTCWFDQDTGYRATAAALAMQQVMAQLAAQPLLEQSDGLAMKAGIATGPTRRFLVGDPAIQWVEALAGRTIDRMAAAQKLAGAGEVLLDEPTASALAEHLQVSQWRSALGEAERFAVVGNFQGAMEAMALPPSLPSLSDATMRPWLLPAVCERLCAGLGEFVAEIRPVTALFLRFTGLDYEDDARAGEKLDELVRQVQALLAHYQGALIDLTIGDKGNYLYAAFGAPIAHEDDTVRAVRVAQQLLDLPKKLAFVESVRIGISRGTMRAGSYGGPTRRTYGVLGDEVNVAARLMEQAAPGEILVSARVRNATVDLVEWEALPAIQLKGKRELIPLYRPGWSTQHRVRVTATLVGRAAECAEVGAALQRVQAEAGGGLLFIQGEAGIGKTRLVEALRETACSLGLPTLVGTGDAVEHATLYHGWRGVFQALPELLADPIYAQQAPLLNSFLASPVPDNEWTASLSSQARADNTRALLVTLLQQACLSGPRVILLDDAHWLDSASWALAEAVSQLLPETPLLLVIALRPFTGDAPSEYDRLLVHPAARSISLTRLPADAVQTLLCQRLGVTHLPESVSGLIQQRAEGHPFFSEELAYALRDAGLLQVVEGEARLRPGIDLQTTSFPDTMQGVIISRIDCLTPAQQVALKVASVIGRVFAFRLLHDIYPIEGARIQLPEHLRTLERLDLTPLDRPEPELAYLFKHIITQEVAYNLLLFTQRQRLHRQVAEWYEQVYAVDLATHAPLLAYHWSRSDTPERAIPHLEQAGAAASRQYASQETITFFSEALRLAEDLPEALPTLQRARWEHLLGEAHEHLGHPIEARQHLERALALYGQPVPTTTPSVLAGVVKQIGRQLLHRLWPRRFLAQATMPEAAVLGAVRSAQLLGAVHNLNSHPLPMMYLNLLALNLAESVGPSPALAQAYANTCYTVFLLPPLTAGYERRARALIAERADDPEMAGVLLALGYFKLAVGAWAQSRADIEQCKQVAERCGHWRQWEEALMLGSALAYSTGQFQEGVVYATTALASARRRGDVQLQGIAMLNQAINQFASAPLDETRALLEQAIRLFVDLPHSRLIEIRCRGVLALLHLYRGELALVRQATEEAMRRTADSGAGGGYASGNYGIVDSYLALWENASTEPERSDFAREARAACTISIRLGYLLPITQPHAWRCQGLAEWLAGRPVPARRAWRKSLALAEQFGVPYEAALTLYELARHTTGGEQQGYINQARAAFERLGAVHDAARVEGVARSRLSHNE